MIIAADRWRIQQEKMSCLPNNSVAGVFYPCGRQCRLLIGPRSA
jgi:hypothetical protein